MIKVSIIILIYNVEDYLSDCIKSALKQTYQNLEILAVNDGSTDNSLSIIEKLASEDDRIKIINKPNGGLASARLAGVKSAKGDFVTLLDGDDSLPEDAISKLVDMAAKTEADIVSGTIYYRYPNLTKDKKLNLKFIGEVQDRITYLNNLLIGKIPWMLVAKLYRRTLFEDILMPPYKVGQDAIVMFQLALITTKIYYFDEPIYFYFQRKSSASYNYSEGHIRDTFRFAQDLIIFLRSKKIEGIDNSLSLFSIRNYITVLHKGGIVFFKDKFSDMLPLYYLHKKELYKWEKLLFRCYQCNFRLGNIANKIIHGLRKVSLYIKKNR